MTPAALEHVASFGWSPLLPVWLLAALAALSGLVAVTGLVGRTSGSVLRLGAAVLVLLWLAGPYLVRATWQSLPQTALLVVDQSGSMSIGARRAVAERAAALVRARIQALDRQAPNRQAPDRHAPPGARKAISVRTVVVPSAASGGTRLFDTIAHATADIPVGQLAGIIAITDGQVHDVPAHPPRRMAGGGASPPFQALLTASGEQTDRVLRVLSAPPYGILNHSVTIRIEVDDLGQAPTPGARARVTMKRDGAAPVARDAPVGTPIDLTVPVSHVGPMLVQLDVSKLPGEVSTLNNQAVLRINGVRDRLRVLLVSGEPNQGERVWRRLLKADPSVDLVHFTILRPPDKDDTTPLNELALIAFPIRELFQEKIGGFDLIILDGFENQGILPMAYLQNIADFVRGGGGLLVTAGPEFLGRGSLQDTPLEDILPAHVPEQGGLLEQQFQPEPTALGRRHPVTADLPQLPPVKPRHGDAGWGPWYRALRPDESHGEVLLATPDGGGASPLLVLSHVGQGRVALLLSDQIWLWSRGEGGGGPQAELLRRLSHWLMKEPALEEEQLSAAITGNQMTVTRRSISPHPQTTITVTAPDGQKQTLTLRSRPDGDWSASVPVSSSWGIWDATDGVRHAYAAREPENALEMADLRTTGGRLASIVRQSGGVERWLGDDPAHIHVPALRLVGPNAQASGSDWIGLRQTSAHLVTGSALQRLLPAWLVLPLALLLLLAGWWREGRRS